MGNSSWPWRSEDLADQISKLGKVWIQRDLGSFRKQTSEWPERIFEIMVVPDRPQPIIKIGAQDTGGVLSVILIFGTFPVR